MEQNDKKSEELVVNETIIITESDTETVTDSAEETFTEVLPSQEPPSIPDSEEVFFLKKILRIQNDGGFGTHLNKIIIERIEELKK